MKKTMAWHGKMMLCLDKNVLRQLDARANAIGVTIQELIRVRAIPEFLYGDITLNPQLVKKLLRRQNSVRQSRWDKWKYPRNPENNGRNHR